MSIPICDLTAENAPLAGELDAAFRRVLASGNFVLGPEVAGFEREAADALGVGHAVGVSSGTDALLAMLTAAGVRAGDEVVTTPYSFFATVEAILRVGARPVFADVEPETLNLDPEQALRRVGPRTRAVLAVHLFGRTARLAPLIAGCAGSPVVVLEDAAQAIGVRSLAATAAAALSFHPSKNLGGFGDGGMVVTRDAALASRVRALRVHGATEKFRHTQVGGNFRLDELQAAMLRVKLPHLRAWNEARAKIASRYLGALAALPMRLPPALGESVWSRFVVRVGDGRRDALADHLRRHGIATAIYYPLPLHLQPALGDMCGRPGEFPVAERAAAEALALPLHPQLTDADVARVCDTVRSFFSG